MIVVGPRTGSAVHRRQSSCSGPSPTRRSSPSRTCGCSTKRKRPRAADGHGGNPAGDRELADRVAAGMDTVAENAALVCGAPDSIIFRLDGDVLRLVTRHGPLLGPMRFGETMPATRDSVDGPGGGGTTDDPRRRSVGAAGDGVSGDASPLTPNRVHGRPDVPRHAAPARGGAGWRHHDLAERSPALLGAGRSSCLRPLPTRR